MAPVNKLSNNLSAFEKFLEVNHLQIFERKEIEYGAQIVVTDGSTRLPVNIYTSGRIIVQGKPSELKTLITEWANLQQAGFVEPVENSAQMKQNRITKYLVIPDNINRIKKDVIENLAGDVAFKETKGAAELYHAEVHLEGKKITITQYKSGTLLIQGLAGDLFDQVCDSLDGFLAQSFSDRATRFIPGDPTWAKTASYLENPDAENEAIQWLGEHLDLETLEFLSPNDQQILTSAAGVRNAILKTKQALEDYSVIVMPFAKVYEGFLIKLASHLGIIEPDKISKKSSPIEISLWLSIIEKCLPASENCNEVAIALKTAWICCNKAIHSNFTQSTNPLKYWEEAEQEIKVIFQALTQAYRLFIVNGIELQIIEGVEKSGRFSEQPIYTEKTFLATQATSDFWIGVDESGKGDLFGPLAVAGVIINSDIELQLAKLGVRDSKTISDGQILELAKKIKEICEFEIQTFLPPDYNSAYETHGRNLNELLAWGHAQVITKLSRRMPVHHALSDQFGDENWLKKALAVENCTVLLEQHPKAESDMAVAAASILARAAFVEAIQDFSRKSGLIIPLGSSAEEVKEVAKIIYRRWGKKGLERIAKMHFKTIREIINEVKA